MQDGILQPRFFQGLHCTPPPFIDFSRFEMSKMLFLSVFGNLLPFGSYISPPSNPPRSRLLIFKTLRPLGAMKKVCHSQSRGRGFCRKSDNHCLKWRHLLFLEWHRGRGSKYCDFWSDILFVWPPPPAFIWHTRAELPFLITIQIRFLC